MILVTFYSYIYIDRVFWLFISKLFLGRKCFTCIKKLQAVKKKHSPKHQNAIPQSIPYQNMFRSLFPAKQTTQFHPLAMTSTSRTVHLPIQGTSLEPHLKSISPLITSAPLVHCASPSAR